MRNIRNKMKMVGESKMLKKQVLKNTADKMRELKQAPAQDAKLQQQADRVRTTLERKDSTPQTINAVAQARPLPICDKVRGRALALPPREPGKRVPKPAVAESQPSTRPIRRPKPVNKKRYI